MRVFFAIEFNNNIKNYLESVQNDLNKYCIKGNFSRKDNLHLTLKFIGEVDSDKLNTLKEVLNNVALTNSPFTLYLDSIGKFNKGNKSIIWSGIKKEDNSLLHLYNSIEGALSKEGFKKESRNYSPHITLCREAIINKDYIKEVDNLIIEKLPIEIKKISLMESTRINGKLTYIPIHLKDLTWNY